MKKKDPTSHRIIEKRRRDRMNNCLTDLSRLIPAHYMKKGRGRIEKTEIIEMAIKYLKDLIEATTNGQQPLQQQPLSNVVGANSSGSETESGNSSSRSSSTCFSSNGCNSGRSSSSSSISSASSSVGDMNSGTINMNFDCFGNTNGSGNENENENNSESRNQVVVWYKKALLVRSISRSPPRR